ncbi:hypothetical protein [Thiocystis minor]|uniref:hypothetical protein n=1 Tax=Thiocystis minor TaxID=61597 RepID=UPI001911DC37|nr:hypothetical protein [Thiocystis minor]
MFFAVQLLFLGSTDEAVNQTKSGQPPAASSQLLEIIKFAIGRDLPWFTHWVNASISENLDQSTAGRWRLIALSRVNHDCRS